MAIDPRLFSSYAQTVKKNQKKKEEDKPWYVDTLEFLQPTFDFISRPKRAITGAMASLTEPGKTKNTLLSAISPAAFIANAITNPSDTWRNVKDAGSAFYGGLSGNEKVDFDQVLNNAGWKQREELSDEDYAKRSFYENLTDPFVGRKGNGVTDLDLFDLVSFTGDVGLDPLTYLTFGAGSLTKAGGKAAYEAVKSAPQQALKTAKLKDMQTLDKGIEMLSKRYEATGSINVKKQLDKLMKTKQEYNILDNISKDLGTNLTATGQRKAIERVAEKQYDDTMESLGGMSGTRNVMSTRNTPEGTERLVDEGLPVFKDVSDYSGLVIRSKPESMINPRLVEKLAEKRMQRVYDIADAGAKPARVAAQNSLINIDVPFLNVVYSIAKKPSWAKVQDPAITALQANALTKLMNEAGATERQIEILNSGKATDAEIQDILSKVGFTPQQKADLVKAVSQGQATDVSQLTRQEFEEAIRRTKEAELRQLDNIGQTTSVVQKTTDEPAKQNVENIANQMKTLMSTKYAKEMDELRAENPSMSDEDIIRQVIKSMNLPSKSGEVTSLATPNPTSLLKRKNFSRYKTIPDEIKTLLDDAVNKLSIMGKPNDIVNEQLLGIAKSFSKNVEDLDEFKTFTKDLGNQRNSVIKGVKDKTTQSKKVAFTATKDKISKKTKDEIAKAKTKIAPQRQAIIKKYKDEYVAIQKSVNDNKNLTPAQKSKYLSGVKKEVDARKAAELGKLADDFSNARKGIVTKNNAELSKRLQAINKGYDDLSNKELETLLKEFDDTAELSKLNKKKELYEMTEKERLDFIDRLTRVNQILDDEVGAFTKTTPTYKNIITQLQKDLRDPTRYVKVGYNKKINETILANPKGVQLSELKKPQTIDVVESTAQQLARNKNFTGLDLKPFQIDAGGASKIGAAIRRKNPFNARTLNSLDENINEMANIIRNTENLSVAQRREMEKLAADLVQSSKNLTPEQKEAIPFLLQKAFPDSYMDDAAATATQAKQVEVQDLKAQLEKLSKNKSKAKAHVAKIDGLKNQIAQASKELTKLRYENQVSYDDALAKIANGDPKVAEQIQSIVGKMEQMYKNVADLEVDAGILKDTRKDYFPHVVNKDMEDTAKLFENDPEIGALIKKSSGNRFAQERKSYQTMAEVDNTLAAMHERVVDMRAKGLDTTDLEKKIEVLSGLYERDPFVALTKRYYKGIKSVAMKKMQTTFKENGFLHLPHETPPNVQDFRKIDKEEARALGLKEGTYIHQEVFNGLNQVRNIFTSKGMNDIFRNLEAGVNMWKTVTTTIVPSHHWYNFVGNATNNTLAGVGADAYKQAEKLMLAQKNGTLTPKQQKLIKDMNESGVLNQTSYADLLPTSNAQMDLEPKNWWQRLEKKTVDNPLTTAIRKKISDPIDNAFRMAHYLDVLSKTRNPKMAADSVRKYLFNYSELTTSDRFLKGLFLPFWNWTKNNLPLQIHKALTTPKYATNYYRLQDQSTQEIQGDENIPDWAKDDYMKFGKELYNPRSPIQDMEMLFSPNKVASSVAPIFKIPTELILNKQFFTGKPIDYDVHYGNKKYISGKNMAEYLVKQTGAGSKAASVIGDIGNKDDSKQWYDIFRDTMIGKSQNLDDVRARSLENRNKARGKNNNVSPEYLDFMLKQYSK